MRAWFAVAVACAACSGPQRGSSPATADFVLLHGDIWTGDRDQPRVQALAIRGASILAIGSDDEIGRIEAPRRIDLGGRLVIPGINDAHVHEPALDAAVLDGRASTMRMVELPGDFDTLTVPAL